MPIAASLFDGLCHASAMAALENRLPFLVDDLLMSTEPFDKRRTPRAQYFLVHQQDNLVPMYAFRSEHDHSAIAALVTDLSEGGVQVLTTVGTPLDSERFDFLLYSGERFPSDGIFRAEVRRVWSRKDGIYTKSGFAFADATFSLANIPVNPATSEHSVLRCVLHPLD